MSILEKYMDLPIPEKALYKNDFDEQWQFQDKDSPMAFYKLEEYKQEALLEWCKGLGKIKATNPYQDSYTVKHLFSRDRFYVSNGAMKGAFLLAGFTPDDLTRLNWRFNISERSLKKEFKAIGVIC